MNSLQKLLLATYLPATVLCLVLDNLFPAASPVKYFKFIVIISLFLTAAIIKKRYPEQQLLSIAMFFVMLGDFFMVFCTTFFQAPDRIVLFGVLSFSIAYCILIAVFGTHLRPGWREISAGLPILLLAGSVTMLLFPHIGGFIKYGLLVFICILGACAWTCVATLFQGYFTRQSSWRIALAGLLMLICDLGVGLSLFHPALAGHFVPWMKNIIWGAYLPAWTLVVLTIAEKNLISPEVKG